MTALPLEPASNDERPRGSSHKEGATVIEDLL